MMNSNLCFNAGSWNVRGLGDVVKCDNVKASLVPTRMGLLGLQETKLGPVSAAKAGSFLPLDLRNFISVDAVGASGGLVSAWDHSLFGLVDSSPSQWALSLDLSLNNDGGLFRFTNVYAPCDRANK
jgi:hypothetical protein